GGANANIAVLHEAWRQGLRVVEIPADLDWTGQEYRRSRHAILGGKSIAEALTVLTQGARLLAITHRRRAGHYEGRVAPPGFVELRDPETDAVAPAAGRESVGTDHLNEEFGT
ncbi:MAG TPA: hypothetical protein VLS51_01460, partial [Propionibacteriaceae bacterium]|nr:hypothetical protein [Propionibacteriaceae bacterium]